MFRFAILVAGAMAIAEPADMKPSCSEKGKAYVTAEKIRSGPDGLYVINAISCQQSCAANPSCKKFTWKGDTTPLKGGCWLVSDADAEVREDPMAISGPRLCPATALRGSGPVVISDMGKSGAKDLHDADSQGGTEKTLVSGASTASRSDADTFLLGLLGVVGVVGAVFGIAGAAHFLLARKPSSLRKTRALKAAPQDEERPIMDETPMPSTSTMPSMPSMQAPMPVPSALTAMPSGPMAQMQPIQYPQYYQPLHIMPPQFAGQP